MSDLPARWQRTTLGDVAEVILGQSPPGASYNDSGEGVPFFQGKAEFGTLYPTVRKWTTEPKKFASKDDVLISVRAPVGPTNLAPVDCSVGRGLAALRAPDGMPTKYLLYALRASVDALASQATGTTFAAVTGQQLRAHEIVVAPPDEQQRIVETIEEQFSRLDAGVESLQRAKRNLDGLRASILQAAIEGRLTASNTAAWDTKPIGQLGHVGSGATPKRGNQQYWVGGAIPWVTSGQLNASLVTEPADYITERALKETNVRLWPAGTILIAMYGEGKTRGKCSELAFPSTTNQACAAIVLNEEFEHLRPFLKLFLTARYEQTRRLASGGVQPNLSLGLIKSIKVPIPPAPDQVRIVAEVERQLSVMDALEGALDSACVRAAGLRRSTLRDAFAGRLVSKRSLLEVADA